MTTQATDPPRPLPRIAAVVAGGGLGRGDELRLLRAAAAGDPGAAERLVEGSYRTVYAALHRLAGGDPELAADLTQETYRKAWAALPEFRGGARFATWLYRIAYTTFLSHARRPRRLVPLEEEPASPVDEPVPDPEEAAARSLAAERLRRAVLGLPEDLRFTVTAHYWRGLPVREIARLEGLTGAAIRKRLKKALDLLAGGLEEARP
ncbi:MAG TPA: sigma-70 family RNA polymerase sigma factor [Thermoanaerobaculia bacterium]|nr:sigma-70 family RNA polymerase sigma factor [Thermoanaerobaculia bacterium]